jgi:hypothetical protein
MTLDHIVAAMTLDRTVTMTLAHTVATIISDTTFAFDTTVEFVIPFVVLLTSSPVMRKEHLWNFCILHRVQLSNLVFVWIMFSCNSSSFHKSSVYIQIQTFQLCNKQAKAITDLKAT